MDRHGRRIRLDSYLQLLPGHRPDALCGRLLKANDASWNVPSRTVESVLAPGEQRSAGIVLDEQVDIDQRRNAADEEEEFLGETGPGIGDVGLNGVERSCEI